MKQNDPTAQEVARELGDKCLAMRSRRLTRQISRLYDEAMRPFGIKASQVNILAAVACHGTVLPKDLAEMLQLETSTLSRNVSRMRAKDWLAETDGEDARQKPLCLAPAGAQLLVALHPSWVRVQQEAERWLGPAGADFLDEATKRARQE